MLSTSIRQTDLMLLAPTALRNFRVKRYQGDDLAIPLGEFTEADQTSIRGLYRFLTTLFETLQGSDSEREHRFQSFLNRQNIADLVHQVQTLGAESYAVHPTPLLGKTIHDLRGGGLTPLLGQLQLWILGLRETVGCDSLFFLTRDHLKIMRNALLGLDDVKRNEDLQTKIHGTDFIVQKWSGAHLHYAQGDMEIEVDCPQPVAISECCVEFGALDRILYNLLNNACRHAAGHHIQLAIFRVPEETGTNLRFVLLNRLTDEDNARLRGTDMATLFRDGVSTTGSGHGLNVAAEFVAHAFGIKLPEEAVMGGYLGAKLLSDQFAIWFHWPIVTDC